MTTNLVASVSESSVIVRLDCGHWSDPMSSASSTFDFPGDPIHCFVCETTRCLDPQLVAELVADIARRNY